MSKTKKTVTLARFIAEHGPTMAAALLGVTPVTLWRWAEHRSEPRGDSVRRLAEAGVTVA